MRLQTAVQTSGKMHKRALHLDRLYKEKDLVIAQQEAAINSRHLAISELQSIVACQEQSMDEQEKILAMMGESFEALHTEHTRLQMYVQQAVPNSPSKPSKVCHQAAPDIEVQQLGDQRGLDLHSPCRQL